MNNKFKKKIYTPKVFFGDIGFLIWNIRRISSAFKNKSISKQFSEKIMNVSSAVNGCVYCSWHHAKQAIKSGISNKEVLDILNQQFQTGASEFELPALLYTQHFAETSRNTDEEMEQKLIDSYGEETANHIKLHIRVVSFGNLFGNTWDAVISRFKGKPAEKSCVIFELFFFLSFFIFMFPLMLLMRKDKNAITSV